MQHLTLEQAVDFMESATIEQSIDTGHTIIHIGNAGTADSPARFVLMNDMYGRTTLSMG